MRTRPLALLRCYSMAMAAETQLLERPRWSITTGNTDPGDGSFNGAVGAFALNNNTIGFSNNAVGDSALFRNITGAANTAVGDLALENNDSNGDGMANFNTCCRRSGALVPMLTAIQTTLSAIYAPSEPTSTGLFNQAMGADALSSNTDWRFKHRHW